MTDTLNYLKELVSDMDDDTEIPIKVGTLMKGAAEIENYRATLERIERVLAFDLRSKITWGTDYNQAVKDIYDATRKALGKSIIHDEAQ